MPQGSTPQRIAPAIETSLLKLIPEAQDRSTPQRIAPAIETGCACGMVMSLLRSTPQRIAPAIETHRLVILAGRQRKQHPPKNRPCD